MIHAITHDRGTCDTQLLFQLDHSFCYLAMCNTIDARVRIHNPLLFISTHIRDTLDVHTRIHDPLLSIPTRTGDTIGACARIQDPVLRVV